MKSMVFGITVIISNDLRCGVEVRSKEMRSKIFLEESGFGAS